MLTSLEKLYQFTIFCAMHFSFKQKLHNKSAVSQGNIFQITLCQYFQ